MEQNQRKHTIPTRPPKDLILTLVDLANREAWETMSPEIKAELLKKGGGMKVLIKRKFGPCPKCNKSLLHNCLKNEVKVVEGGKENPKKVFYADLYKCFHCGVLVVTDFGNEPRWTVNPEEKLSEGSLVDPLRLKTLIEGWTRKSLSFILAATIRKIRIVR